MEKVKCVQFEVCASLSDRDYLRKVETEPTKLLILDSDHKLWLWEPTRRGSFPNILPGLAKHNGESTTKQPTYSKVWLPILNGPKSFGSLEVLDKAVE